MTTGPSEIDIEFGEEVRIPKASDIIAARIKQEVVLGRFPIGMALPPESKLCGWLSVSKSTLKEALRVLEIDGIVEFKTGPKGGAIVRRPSSSTVTRSIALMSHFEQTRFCDLLEASREIEPACARLAAERATETDLIALEDNIVRSADPRTDQRIAFQLSGDFHIGVAVAAKNDILRFLTIALNELTYVCIKDLQLDDEVSSVETRAVWSGAHRLILDAIRAGDSTLAEHRMRKHVVEIDAFLRKFYGRLDSHKVIVRGNSF